MEKQNRFRSDELTLQELIWMAKVGTDFEAVALFLTSRLKPEYRDSLDIRSLRLSEVLMMMEECRTALNVEAQKNAISMSSFISRISQPGEDDESD